MSTRHTRFHTLNEDYKSFGNIIFSSNGDKSVKYIALYNETVSRRWNQSIKTKNRAKINVTAARKPELSEEYTIVFYGFICRLPKVLLLVVLMALLVPKWRYWLFFRPIILPWCFLILWFQKEVTDLLWNCTCDGQDKDKCVIFQIPSWSTPIPPNLYYIDCNRFTGSLTKQVSLLPSELIWSKIRSIWTKAAHKFCNQNSKCWLTRAHIYSAWANFKSYFYLIEFKSFSELVTKTDCFWYAIRMTPLIRFPLPDFTLLLDVLVDEQHPSIKPAP